MSKKCYFFVKKLTWLPDQMGFERRKWHSKRRENLHRERQGEREEGGVGWGGQRECVLGMGKWYKAGFRRGLKRRKYHKDNPQRQQQLLQLLALALVMLLHHHLLLLGLAYTSSRSSTLSFSLLLTARSLTQSPNTPAGVGGTLTFPKLPSLVQPLLLPCASSFCLFFFLLLYFTLWFWFLVFVLFFMRSFRV